MHVKMLRTRVRPLILNFTLFLLGVMTCLMFVQMTNNEIDSPIAYTSPQDFQSAQQLQIQAQPESPCDQQKRLNVDTKVLNSPSAINGGDKPSQNSNVYFGELNLPIEDSSKKVGNGYVHARIISEVDNSEKRDISDGGSTVWVVTPTFYRPEQKAELTRLAQALLPVRNFVHWIVVDDVSQGSNLSYKYLESFMSSRFSSLTYTLLKSFPPKSTTKIVGKPRGVGGRRAAIDWLRKYYKDKKSTSDGVVYFADDDNSYDSDIFRQMRNTKKVSMWPVGLVTDYGVSSPIVKNGQVVGFYDGWNGLRKFPVDMAGFAINIQLFLDKPEGNMPWVAGYEEDELLRSLGVTIKDIHPLANNCTEILVWHTKAVKNVWPKRPKSLKQNFAASTNLIHLLHSLPQKNLAGPSASNKDDSGFSFLNLIFGGL